MKPLRALAFMLATAIPASAQFIAKKIIFTHPGPYTQAQLEDAAGMHPGKFTNDQLNDAAERLADCGYLDNVAAPRVEGYANALTVYFDFTPTDHSQMAQL